MNWADSYKNEKEGSDGRKENMAQEEKIIMGALAVLLFAAAGIFIYIQAYYHALPDIQEVLHRAAGSRYRWMHWMRGLRMGIQKAVAVLFFIRRKGGGRGLWPLMREIAAEDFSAFVRMPDGWRC